MIESLIAFAMPYLTDLILKNEEVQKFPKDFVSASTRWIRSWFLEDDPVTKKVVESDNPTVTKEAVLRAKLTELVKNSQFVEELQGQLVDYNIHRSPTKRNTVEESKLKADGGIHIGTRGIGASNIPVDIENSVEKGSELTAGKDIHIGNDNTKQ